MLKVALIDDEINDLLKVVENLVSLDPRAERIKLFPILLSSDTQESVEKQLAWWQKDVRAALAAKNVFDIVFPALPSPLGPLDVTKPEECATLLDFIAGLDADVLVSDSSMKEEYAGIELLETALSDPRWAGNNWQCWLMTKWPRIAKTIQDSRFRWRGKFDPLACYIDKNKIIKSAGSGVCYATLRERVIDLAIERKDAGRKVKGITHFGRLVGQSPLMNGERGVYESIEACTRDKDASVFITGDTGTGKEFVAREIHERTQTRRHHAFVAVNCAAIPSELIETELFGHEKGAFTGALAQRKGRFEQANGGTIFLDEIGDMSASVQAKLLRVLQERCVERVSGSESIPIDVRVISATHHNIKQMIKEGRFRPDLYYRLNTFLIHLPSLDERPEDIPLLANYFIESSNQKVGRENTISEEAMEVLQNHTWPGNVRELKSIIKRTLMLTPTDHISKEVVLISLNQGEKGILEAPPGPQSGALSASSISLLDYHDKTASEIWQCMLDGKLKIGLTKLRKPLGLKKVVEIADLADAWALKQYNLKHPPEHECKRLFKMTNNAYKVRLHAYRKELEQL